MYTFAELSVLNSHLLLAFATLLDAISTTLITSISSHGFENLLENDFEVYCMYVDEIIIDLSSLFFIISFSTLLTSLVCCSFATGIPLVFARNCLILSISQSVLTSCLVKVEMQVDYGNASSSTHPKFYYGCL